MNELTTQLAKADISSTQPDWLRELRHSGAEQFRNNGLPTRKDEAWKYTPLGALGQGDIQLSAGRPASSGKAVMAAALTTSGLQANILDGGLSDIQGEPPAGVSVMTLGAALAAETGGLKSMLEALPAQGSAQAFTELNTATLERGLVTPCVFRGACRPFTAELFK